MLNNKGQSLLEVILAVALFGFICSALVSMSLGGFSSLRQGGEYIEAEAYAQEGIEAVRAVRDSAWNKIIYNNSAVTSTGNIWQFVGENTSSTFGKYKRTIVFANVCRDAFNNITACPGSYTDLNSKQATVIVSWLSEHNAVNTIQKITYLTNWESRDWTQTDWSGGSEQAIWSNNSKYNSDDGNLDSATAGEIKLKNTGNSCAVKNWSFDSAGDYAYNASKIEVTNSVARLLGSATGGPIDANTMGMWHLDEASGDVIDFSENENDLTNIKGSPLYSQSGKFSTAIQFSSNSARYINNGQQTGLSITGAITIDAWIYRTTSSSVVEGIVTKWRETGNKRSYALAVNATNQLQFYLSSDGSNQFTVTAINQVPLNSWVHAAAVYDGAKMYIFQNGTLENSTAYNSGIADKAAFVSVSGADAMAGGDAFFNGKIDEARVSNIARWTGSFTPPAGPYGPSTYPSDNPTINPNTSNFVNGVDVWSGFAEAATKNGGEVYYQLSSDNGATWKYWSGAAWAAAGAGNYNTAGVINANIGTFTTSTKQIVFKAFLSSDGEQQVILDNVQISCAKQYEWTFGSASDYTYNAGKIAVTGGTVSLVDQGGGGSCSGTATVCSAFVATSTCQAQAGCSWGGAAFGATTNPNFDTNSNGWTYADWETANQVDGDRQANGGNPSGYIRVVVNGKKNNNISGYWQQSFATTANSPEGTVSFDWKIPSYSATGLTSYYLYVYVEPASGAPTLANYVWRSPLISGTTNWVTVSNVNIAAKIPTAGTYYLKVAARGIYNATNGPGTTIGAFDNVQLNWTKANSCSGTPTVCNTYVAQGACQAQGGCSWASVPVYPSDKPTINPTTVYNGVNINAWAGFSEIATKNGGEIYYQLSTDGALWKYWNGAVWSNAGAGNYNTASVVNTNIGTFSTSTGHITFKAFLNSNGSQQVILDNVRVGWGENSSGGYATNGNFTSSAFNMSDVSPVQILTWDENKPANTNVQLQIHTAPNNGGSPGAWGSWYGSSGSGTYFTNHSGTLLPTALNGNQWVQYRAELRGDGASTPILQEVRVNYK